MGRYQREYCIVYSKLCLLLTTQRAKYQINVQCFSCRKHYASIRYHHMFLDSWTTVQFHLVLPTHDHATTTDSPGKSNRSGTASDPMMASDVLQVTYGERKAAAKTLGSKTLSSAGASSQFAAQVAKNARFGLKMLNVKDILCISYKMGG